MCLGRTVLAQGENLPLQAFCAVMTVAGGKVRFSAVSHFHVGEVSIRGPFGNSGFLREGDFF